VATVIADDLKVCVDCVQVIANGEINDGTDRGDEVAAAQVAIWGDDAIGLVLTGSIDDPGGELGFYWSSCDGCGSTLGGDRHAAAVLSR
jgi:hypothetical protein